MRRLFHLFLLIGLLALHGAAAFADPASLAPTVPPAPVAAKTAETAPIKDAVALPQITPHRAIYNMTLASVKNGSNITDVSGKIVFEWRDVCDGWAIQQHMNLHFTYAQGEDQDTVSTELTWESKDGSHYNFNIHHVTNGQETETYRGKAERNSDGTISVSYDLPENKTLKLPTGTLFPTSHTKLIIQKAMEAQPDGDKLFTRRVFDGSDKEGSSDISAFIMPEKPIAEATSINDDLKKNPLLATPAWPVHLAFFAPTDNDTGEADYEMDLTLLPNGIARHMKIDYGDFAVIGALTDVQPLPTQRCK